MKSADPTGLAKELVADIPLEEICQDQDLMNAFLAEMLLAISRASTKENHKKRQAKGIASAKARGVKFCSKAPPLPDNFDEIRFVWRKGKFNLKHSAKLCGMPKSTFYNAVRCAEKTEAEKEMSMDGSRNCGVVESGVAGRAV